MEYQEQTISLACADDRVVTVRAMQGVGTGLAYHPVPSQPDLFGLTHVPTGYAISYLTVPTEPEIRAFLERVAILDCDAWQIGLATLKRRYNSDMRFRIELAHYDSLSQYETFMYPESNEPESFDAVEDPQAASNIALAVEIFFYREYAKPVQQVKLVRMNRETGEHETLHTYVREEMMPRGLAFIAHLLKLALIHGDLEAGEVEGQFELKVDGWLATIDLGGKHVCLWDFYKNGNWEVYSVVDLAGLDEKVEELDEEARMERMRIYWEEQPHVNTFGDYGLPQILPEGFVYQRPVCEMSQQEAASLHSGGVEA